MSCERNSATPSSGERRSPACTFSAIVASAGSLTSFRSSVTGCGTLLLEALDGQCHVVPTETEAVAQRRAKRALLRRVWRVVEIELRIGRLVVDGRRHHPF